MVEDDAIRCDACPVLCYIKPGRTGACDRYANDNGQLVRIDPHVVLDRAVSRGDSVVPFLDRDREWDGSIVTGPENFVTAIGAGTTYPDYKPAPFIISSTVQGVDMVTVVTEGIFSYCGVKVKIDTDRHLGPETNLVRAQGEPVGHVTTSEYGSQMLSLGGVRHLTGGSRKEGTVTCETLLNLCDRKPVELTIDDGATVMVQAGKPPVVDGVQEERMRVGCGSATIGMFAKQWFGKVDEVVVVDDHITGVLSEHQAGKLLGVRETGIKMKGHRSTPGRYFRVAEPGTAWGGTNIADPLSILQNFNPKFAWPKLRLLMVSTTGEHHAYFELDEALRPVEKELPAVLSESVARIRENCEPALCSVLFMGGAGGSLRAGVTENPVRLTHSVRDALTRVTCGGAPVYVWPGGGITFMVDVTRMPEHAFGYVPTPALVAPIEFTLKVKDYAALGGYMDHVRSLDSIMDGKGRRRLSANPDNPWPLAPGKSPRPNPGSERMKARAQIRWLEDGRRLHLHDGPIDLIVEAFGSAAEINAAYRAAAERFVHVLDELCGELGFLRQATQANGPLPSGVIARRMIAAVTPYCERIFITPMAAVAGAVAEEILDAMTAAARLSRAYVNNGGDIALHLASGEQFVVGMVERPDCPSLFGTRRSGFGAAGARHRHQRLARPQFLARDRRRGDRSRRSCGDGGCRRDRHRQRSRLAGTSQALCASRANRLAPDSDLGERLVTQGVGELSPVEIETALDAGVRSRPQAAG